MKKKVTDTVFLCNPFFQEGKGLGIGGKCPGDRKHLSSQPDFLIYIHPVTLHGKDSRSTFNCSCFTSSRKKIKLLVAIPSCSRLVFVALQISFFQVYLFRLVFTALNGASSSCTPGTQQVCVEVLLQERKGT